MPWSTSLPADSSKIRLSAGLIRANWLALETGGVPFDYIQLQEQVLNPTQTNNSGWTYTKEFSSQTELYYMDDRATPKVTQITSNGRLGSSSTEVRANGITLVAGFTNLQDGFVTAWGKGAEAGGLDYGYNIASVTRTATGEYTILTNAVFNDANVAVLLTSYQASSNTPAGITIDGSPTIAGNQISFDIEIKDRSGVQIDRRFFFAILGGI